jgi:hypothetical protein
LTCLERRSLLGKMELSGAAGDGSLEEDRPSGKLVSTMLTLVWAIAGICGTRRFRGARGADRDGVAYGIAYVGRHVEDE